MNEELINAMNQLKAQREQLIKSGGDPSAINDQLVKLGQQFKYAPQKPLILPPEQIDINYPGFAGGGKIGKMLEHAKSLPFVHFSNAPSISQLDPRMYGKGIKGAEADRLKEALDIKPRSYFYVDKPGVKPEQGLGPHKYQGTAEGIYPLDQDPLGLSAIAKQKSLDPYLMSQGIQQVDEKQQLNELERLIKQAGYKGYANDDVGLLFYPTPVKKAVEGKAGGGKVGALEALVKKILPAAEREANKAKFLEGSAVKDRLYHGTNADFQKFNPQLTFLSTDPKVANQFTSELETGGNIMPVYAQVKNPFDYENPKHVKQILKQYNADPKIKQELFDTYDISPTNIKENLSSGNYSVLEAYPIQDMIKKLGHDAFYLKEGIGGKNLGVYDPNKIKSAIGNEGTYDITNPDITKKEGGLVGYAPGGSVFNPEGADYDYQTAMAYGMGPTGTGEDLGHWGSVAPTSDD
ncbi:MAG: hypothetical protein EBR60_10790, partial [Burkholderiaceae bacterium]|nr:hypothetical protein [Burkholderiaceae bacterium]